MSFLRVLQLRDLNSAYWYADLLTSSHHNHYQQQTRRPPDLIPRPEKITMSSHLTFPALSFAHPSSSNPIPTWHSRCVDDP
jgi:hypothetical protein